MLALNIAGAIHTLREVGRLSSQHLKYDPPITHDHKLKGPTPLYAAGRRNISSDELSVSPEAETFIPITMSNLDHTKTSVEKLKAEGNAFHTQGHLEDAILKYTEAIQLDQGNAILYANRSASHLSMKK